MTKTNILIALALFLFSHESFATKGGHGGVALVCREFETQRGEYAEILDIWEWNQAHQSQIGYSSENSDLQLKRAVMKLKASNAVLGDRVEQALSVVTEVAKHMSTELVDLKDADILCEDCIPKFCAIEQVAVYHEDPRTRKEELSIQAEIFSMLEPTGQAALFLHEAIYRVYRQEYGDVVFKRAGVPFKLGTTSRMTRSLVGALLSPLEFTEVEPRGWRHATRCEGLSLTYLTDGRALHLIRAGVHMPTAASGKITQKNLVNEIEIKTAFNPLGGELKLRIKPTKDPNQYLVESTGSMLNLAPEVVTCK